MRRRSGWRPGFTLIEMVVVLIIVGVVGAVVVPSLARPPAPDPDAFAAPLTSVLRTARRMAADSGRVVVLVVDPTTGRYAAAMEGSDSTRSGTIALPVGGGMTADSARALFTFDPAGPASGDSLWIASGGRSAVVGVNAWTGEAVVRAL